ncbi:MAG TPA: extracellular solute-binding protein [Kiloniellales bacterium]|nr:extracellular solute-binding protein [Kiloniellales bacterium]
MTRPRGGFSRRSFLAGTGAVAAGLSFGPKFAFGAEEPELNFYNWDTYIGETTLDDFKEVSGIDVTMDLYADNDELFAKLKEGNPGYDVIVPTNDFVERMISANMLLPLDHGLIPNIKNINPVFMDADFDPGRKYSLPYMWGTQGIGYRKSRVSSPPDSWKVLLESDEYSGRIALLSEATSILGVALKYLGYSYNSKNPAEIKEAEELLTRQKPHIKVFAEDNGQDLLLSGEVDLTMEWNGDILQVMEEDDDISYVVPKEGSLLWQDCLCIPTGAPHRENAHKFINFILDAEAGAKIAEFIYYATPNAAARELLPDEYNKNPAIFPDQETLARCEPAIYLGEDVQRLYDEAWTRILAA